MINLYVRRGNKVSKKNSQRKGDNILQKTKHPLVWSNDEERLENSSLMAIYNKLIKFFAKTIDCIWYQFKTMTQEEYASRIAKAVTNVVNGFLPTQNQKKQEI